MRVACSFVHRAVVPLASLSCCLACLGQQQGRAWGPEQASGPPNTPGHGDIQTAWASLTEDAQDEWLVLTYETAVVPATVEVHETYNPGALVRVSAFTPAGAEVAVWEGTDPVARGSGRGVAAIPVAAEFATTKVKLYLNSTGVPGWNEIDAVALVDAAGNRQWAQQVEASSTYAERGQRFGRAASRVQRAPVGQGMLRLPRQRHIRTEPFLKTSPENTEHMSAPFPVLALDDGRALVPATRLWSATGVWVERGQAVSISGTGQVRGCRGPVRDWAFGPWGPEGSVCEGTDYEGHRLCALIGKLAGRDDGLEEFLVGRSFSFEAPFPGQLYLGVSDTDNRDNEGAFAVRVSIDGQDVDFGERQELLHEVLAGYPDLVPEGAQQVSYVDSSAEGRDSFGASGHAVAFERPEGLRFVEAVEICASRYGARLPPGDPFHLYLLNDEQQVLADLRFPYALIDRGEVTWYTLRTPSVEVPSLFGVGLNFNPGRSKGIYLGRDESVDQSHSYKGLPDTGYENVDGAYDWMVRVYMTAEPTARLGLLSQADWSPAATDPFADGLFINFADGASQGQQSYGGRGPGVRFVPAEHLAEGIDAGQLELVGFQVYASRYGSGYDPEETLIELALADEGGNVRHREVLTYAPFSYREQWVDLVLSRPLALADLPSPDASWLVALDPGAGRSRGIYFHYREPTGALTSLVGTAQAGFEPVEGREWMIRVCLRQRQSPQAGE